MAVILAAVMVAVMVPGNTVFAMQDNTEVTQGQGFTENIVTPHTLMFSGNITQYWRNVLTAPTNGPGFGRTISISVQNNAINHVNDIRMLDRNGNELWSFNNAIGSSHENVRFWLGTDVYFVQLRVRSVSNVNHNPLWAQAVIRWA